MTSLKDKDATGPDEKEEVTERKDNSELPPSGTGLHKRRRGEAPASLNVKPQALSDVESSPCTSAPTPSDFWTLETEPSPDPVALCELMIQKLKDKNDSLSQQEKESVTKTKDTLESVNQLEKLLDLLEQFVSLKEHNAEMLKQLEDAEHIKRLDEAKKRIDLENERLKEELQWLDETVDEKKLQKINKALDDELEDEYCLAIFDSLLIHSKHMKRSGSKWKPHSRFGGSLLRRQRSRSAGGEESDAGPSTPSDHRRRSEAMSCKEVDKSKVSKWTRVKAAFRWEKAQWPAAPMGGATGAVVAGALVGAVALAGSAPPSATGTLNHGESLRDASLTPGSPMSLTPNSSCEELRMDSGSYNKSGILRCDENDNTFLHAPTQDDSSTSPSPNKLHKSPWGKMREIIQTKRESVRKKSSRGSKSSPDVVPSRRRSLSDGGDSDAPPALTVTVPSSEELESDSHPLLRKQRSLELSARPPQQRPPRASKWSKVKRAFLTSASASVPSSPSRHSAFFTDAETEGLSSGCEASAVREEIARDYAALQSRLRREFSDRQGKLYAASRPVATEDQLSADFKKKLTEWQRMKGVRQPPPVPARQDLSDDFLKKWDAWTRMKDTNSVPAWEEEAKPDEVLVQTSTGLFKFQGISRSFTRKLHEWEKSRGIAPEASTSALLRAAKARNTKAPAAPLTRTQSDGSVAPSLAGSGRHHASSLSVNDADTIDLEFERDSQSLEGYDACDGDPTRGALLVEVEAQEVCTAAPLVAVSPRHMPQQPVYTYGHAEARLLCETRSAVTGTALRQPNSGVKRKDNFGAKSKEKNGDQSKPTDKNNKERRKLGRQTSFEEDAQLIREAIEEVERGSSSRFKETKQEPFESREVFSRVSDTELPSTSKEGKISRGIVTPKRQHSIEEESNGKRKEADKTNGNNKKKSKSRARLEREQSKPSESDTEIDVDTVTVEIPRRRKRAKKPTEKPRTPPTSLHSDSEGDVFVLKLKAPEPRQGSPEVIVKTTRKIFSPVVRSGETVPSAVIPVNVDDLAEVNSSGELKQRSRGTKQPEEMKPEKNKREINSRSKSSGDLQESVEQRPKRRPPLPLSPSSQRKPQAKETAPSIRIMIQRYNMKIHEEDAPGHTSGASSGTSSPAWRSPAAERRRPPDMPPGVNIRNNPFLEREVQKSASACQLSRKEAPSAEKPLTPTLSTTLDGVLKSHSANALHPELKAQLTKQRKESQETITYTASTDTIVPPDLTRNLPVFSPSTSQNAPNISRERSSSPNCHLTPDPRQISEMPFDRLVSVTDAADSEAAARATERAARIKAARDRFLSSPVQMRREGTSSASDLRAGDRSSRISCESDVTEAQASRTGEEAALGRSASTGMVNVDREAWERVTEGHPRQGRSHRSRFSLARLAAKLRRKDEGAVSRLCRQSLLVQLRNKQ